MKKLLPALIILIVMSSCHQQRCYPMTPASKKAQKVQKDKLQSQFRL